MYKLNLSIKRFCVFLLVFGIALTQGMFTAANAQTTEENSVEFSPDEGWQVSGEVSLMGRWFFDDGLYHGQEDGLIPMLEGRFNVSRSWAGASPDNLHRIVVEAYGRWDNETDTSVIDLPEAYYQYVGIGHEVLVGSHVEFWGVAESYNPVNIINQKDVAGDIRSRMVLGQPMVKLDFGNEEFGNLSLLALVGFRERQYGDRTSRFRSPFVVDNDLAHFEDDEDFSFAARYSNTVAIGTGSLDFALSYFNGTSRDPKLLPACVRDSGSISQTVCNQVNREIRKFYERNAGKDDDARFDRLRRYIAKKFNDKVARMLSGLQSVGLQPYYQQLEQIGLETVYAFGDWQAKFEGAWKSASGESYISAVAGFEYTMDNFASSDATVSLIGEYLYDNRSFWQPVTVFDNDIFGAVRVGFNDANNTSATAGVFYDLDTSATIGIFEFSTRLSDSLNLGVSANVFNTNGWNDPLAAIRHDSYLDVKLTKYF